MSEIVFDDYRFPLVIIRYPKSFSDEAFARHFDTMDTYLDRGQPFAVISDSADSDGPTANQRRLAGERMKERREVLTKNVVAQAAIVRSAVQRGLYTAIMWFMPAQPYPFKFVSSMAEAEAYCGEMLVKRGLKVPPRVA